MASWARRRLLASLGTASVVATAGCLAGDASSPPRFSRLTAVNHDPRAYTVRVVVLAGEEPVYWAAEQATAATATTAGGAVFDGYPTTPGEYVLHARLADRPRDEWVALDFADFDTECLAVSLSIGEHRTDDSDGELSLWYSTNPTECDDAASTPGAT